MRKGGGPSAAPCLRETAVSPVRARRGVIPHGWFLHGISSMTHGTSSDDACSCRASVRTSRRAAITIREHATASHLTKRRDQDVPHADAEARRQADDPLRQFSRTGRSPGGVSCIPANRDDATEVARRVGRLTDRLTRSVSNTGPQPRRSYRVATREQLVLHGFPCRRPCPRARTLTPSLQEGSPSPSHSPSTAVHPHRKLMNATGACLVPEGEASTTSPGPRRRPRQLVVIEAIFAVTICRVGMQPQAVAALKTAARVVAIFVVLNGRR